MVWVYPIETLEAVLRGERSIGDVVEEHRAIAELLTDLIRECPRAARYLKAAKDCESEDLRWLLGRLLREGGIPAKKGRKLCPAKT